MISLYEVDDEYIDYLQKFDKNVLSTKADNRNQTRKYIGILLHNKNCMYFAPLSSYKPDVYDSMYESKSLKKIGNMGVLRINNMIPVFDKVIHKVDFSEVLDEKYRNLLLSEYRILKPREREIRTDSRIVYYYRTNNQNSGKKLYKICCDFKLLENKMIEYTCKFI